MPGPLGVRTTETSASEGRLKVAAGGKSTKAKKRKKLVEMVSKSCGTSSY